MIYVAIEVRMKLGRLIHDSSGLGSFAKELMFGLHFEGFTTFLLLRRWWTSKDWDLRSVNLPNARLFCEVKGEKKNSRNMLSIKAILKGKQRVKMKGWKSIYLASVN